jgi:cellulose synthase/poly-beta-1,6-N-acetylglucosamine synthase-like glycosyltransferase
MSVPRVDVLIAARNEEARLGECLDALRAQDYPAERLRVHVIDDRSTDRTASVAAERGVTVWRSPGRGQGAARNHGLAQSAGDLVGFLDAHCVPERSWVALLAASLDVADIGGAQGFIENTSVDPRVQAYLTASGMHANERVLEDTITGKRNIYPWMLGGNCMYRREAIAEAGGFNEHLEACEDVDLAWRVALLGYRFRYVPGAKVMHVDGRSWRGFVRKGLTYGRGAAQVAAMYRPDGAREKFAPAQVWSGRSGRWSSGLYYWLGYRQKEWQIRVTGGVPPAHRPASEALSRLRPPFQWTPGLALRISPDVVFWLREPEQASVIVHRPTRQRIVLDSAGDFIWRRLARGSARDQIVHELTGHYGIAPVTAASDLDDLVEELMAAGVIAAVTA